MVLSVLRGLTEPGALDELGIGTIRDGFSNILFPGTSTIQTRAKYLFIVPYLCMDLERAGKLSPREFIASLEQHELDLIGVLSSNGAEGVIGQRSGQALRRKPSSIYWSALRTYGFISEPVSLSEYAALFHVRNTESEQMKGFGKRKARYEEDATDDNDSGMGASSFWRVPGKENWRKNLTIDLTADEASYLHERITSMPNTRGSLLALVLRENRLDFPEYGAFDDLHAMTSIMSPDLLGDYQLACDFSRFIFGAQVQYNIIYSSGRNELANELWEKYLEERPTVSLTAIQARLKPRAGVMRFLKMYQDSISKETELKELVVRRERELKGSARAKLTNTESYPYNSNSVNMAQLTYRLTNAQRIVKDIFEGMGRHA
jgi:hypothetical protein